jgi:hypothetical protein
MLDFDGGAFDGHAGRGDDDPVAFVLVFMVIMLVVVSIVPATPMRHVLALTLFLVLAVLVLPLDFAVAFPVFLFVFTFSVAAFVLAAVGGSGYCGASEGYTDQTGRQLHNYVSVPQ